MQKCNQLEMVVRGFLGDKRYKHSLCVAEEAVRIAKKYGADIEKARIAGILHDIMKETSPDIQLKIIGDSGIILNNIELFERKLWHQCAGMAYVKDVLKIDDEDILNAIRYHTSGRANMSILEKVIFVADFTSKDRDYNGVSEMRNLCEKSLEAAMVEGLSFAIIELGEEKRPIVADTINAYNQAVQNMKKD